MKSVRKIAFGLLIVAMIMGALVTGAPQQVDAKPLIFITLYADSSCLSGVGVRVVIVDGGDETVIEGCLGGLN